MQPCYCFSQISAHAQPVILSTEHYEDGDLQLVLKTNLSIILSDESLAIIFSFSGGYEGFKHLSGITAEFMTFDRGPTSSISKKCLG